MLHPRIVAVAERAFREKFRAQTNILHFHGKKFVAKGGVHTIHVGDWVV